MAKRDYIQAIADACDDAYDIIDMECGWWNGGDRFGPEDEGVCLVMALSMACQRRRTEWAFVPAVEAVKRHVGAESLPRWNDKQTEYIVLRTLEGVADAYRSY